MKHISVWLIFLLLIKASFSQIKTDSLNAKAIKIKLQKDTTSFAFNSNLNMIKVLDARDDSSGVGYFVSFLGVVKQYVFATSLENELKIWYSNYLMVNEQNNTGSTLFVNIKKLRLSNEVSPIIYEDGHVGQPNEGWEKGVIVKIEYYLQKDSFFTPLYRFDSIITLKQRLRNNADDYVSTALKLSLSKLFTLNLNEALLSKKKITLNDILRVNRQTHDLPIYTSSINKKGVYKTFAEFKMNNPSIEIFEFRKGKMGDILYVKENGTEYPTRSVWGYCDGNNLYINSGDKYSKLVRSGYTFYFEGIKAISRTSSSSNYNYPTYDPNFGIQPGRTASQTKFTKEIRYYQVDMETGKVY